MGASDTVSEGIGGETGVRLAHVGPAAQAPDIAGLEARVVPGANRANEQIAQARGLTENLSREALFRRSLLTADVVAIVGAFVLLAQLSSRSLQLTWVSIGGLLTLLVGVKLFGLYDRDEALLHKTTLDEAPKLFHVATLGALLAWLAGGFVVKGGTLDRHEALLLWLMLLLLLVVVRVRDARVPATGRSGRTLPVHRRSGVGRDDQIQALLSWWGEGRDGRPPGPR